MASGRSKGRPPWTRCLSLAVALALIATGCGDASFVPARPPELEALRTLDASAPKAVTLRLVLGPDVTRQNQDLEQQGRQEANRAKAHFDVVRPTPGQPPSAQAALIRAAAGKANEVLLVEPADDPAVAGAVREVAARGTPVVLVGGGLPGTGPGLDPSLPVSTVTFGPCDEAARRLVEAVLADAPEPAAGKAGPGRRHALVAVRSDPGPGIEDAAGCVRRALEAAGVGSVAVARVSGVVEADVKSVRDRLAADPALAYLFGVEVDGTNAVLGAVLERKTGPRPAVGGVLSLDTPLSDLSLATFAGVIDRNVPALAREAVSLGLRRSRGEPAPARRELPVVFRLRPPKDRLPTQDPTFRPPHALPGPAGAKAREGLPAGTAPPG